MDHIAINISQVHAKEMTQEEQEAPRECCGFFQARSEKSLADKGISVYLGALCFQEECLPGRGLAQRQSMCFACVMPWVPASAPQNEKINLLVFSLEGLKKNTNNVCITPNQNKQD